jgi:hypothetical protein
MKEEFGDWQKAWKDVDVFDLSELKIKEIFELGYRTAWLERQGEWEDGYAHGYDEGRYKSIEEG